jgi:hypothetical protein
MIRRQTTHSADLHTCHAFCRSLQYTTIYFTSFSQKNGVETANQPRHKWSFLVCYWPLMTRDLESIDIKKNICLSVLCEFDLGNS